VVVDVELVNLGGVKWESQIADGTTFCRLAGRNESRLGVDSSRDLSPRGLPTMREIIQVRSNIVFNEVNGCLHWITIQWLRLSCTGCRIGLGQGPFWMHNRSLAKGPYSGRRLATDLGISLHTHEIGMLMCP
jgi:hypothetical protein